MQVSGTADEIADAFAPAKASGRGRRDIIDEVAGTVLAVADEGAACRIVRVDGYCRDIDAVTLEPFEIHSAEIIGADSADHRCAAAKPPALGNEDRRRAAGKRSNERLCLHETIADRRGDDFHEDLPDANRRTKLVGCQY